MISQLLHQLSACNTSINPCSDGEQPVFLVQDADSLDTAGTKKEGAFYLWTEEEVKEVLGQHALMFIAHYYIKAQGNADLSPRSDPHHEFRGLNCLRQAQTLQETAGQAGVSEEEARQTLAMCRKKLHERRGKRPRPHLDDKVIVSYISAGFAPIELPAGRLHTR